MTSKQEKEIIIQGMFKKCNLFNDTIHIILYPKDGLRSAVNLQEIDEGTEITITVKEKECLK